MNYSCSREITWSGAVIDIKDLCWIRTRKRGGAEKEIIIIGTLELTIARNYSFSRLVTIIKSPPFLLLQITAIISPQSRVVQLFRSRSVLHSIYIINLFSSSFFLLPSFPRLLCSIRYHDIYEIQRRSELMLTDVLRGRACK